MDILFQLADFILHIDIHLGEIIVQYGIFAYAVLFLIIFAETGLVFTPFLPGDSLLFAAGAFAALGSFNLAVLLLLLWLAAFLGDTSNYWIGHFFGKKIIANPKIPINQSHIDKAQRFYEKYGGKTIFLARFIPMMRTFAPFVAGVGKMDYLKFIYFNALGGVVWIGLFVSAGYFFGNIPQVKDNFFIVILAIIILSVMPLVVEAYKARYRNPEK
ncbi:DedA family protein [Candidatus Uhrbacteria bacterium]|nr:DedA family protein [Candidatus Uhrbacteria bacterium]